MINKIEKKLKGSDLKTWTALAREIGQNESNFKRRLMQNIDRINCWLKHIGLELCVKEVNAKE